MAEQRKSIFYLLVSNIFKQDKSMLLAEKAKKITEATQKAQIDFESLKARILDLAGKGYYSTRYNLDTHPHHHRYNAQKEVMIWCDDNGFKVKIEKMSNTLGSYDSILISWAPDNV